MKLGGRFSKSELQSSLFLLVFLLDLKLGYLQPYAVECDWSVQRLSCPPYATTDWECLKTQLNCTNGGEYHCLRDQSGEWTEICAKPIKCSKGQEPVLKHSQIECTSCRDPERYEPVEGTESYKYSECRRKKTTCPRDVSYECPVDDAVRHAQNRLCRCVYEKDYMPQNYDLNSETWICKEPDDLHCIHVPCPEDVYGNEQTRGSDYRCVRLSLPVTATPSKKPTQRTSPYILTQTPKRPDAPEEETESFPSSIIGVTLVTLGGILIAILLLIFFLAVCWLKNRNQSDAPVSLEAKDASYFQLQLSWQPPQKGYIPTHYILEKREAGSLIWVRINMILAEENTEYKVEGLKAGTWYSFRVIAKSVKGKSKPCETESPTQTIPIRKPRMPQGLSGCFDEGQKCIMLRWDEINDDGGSEILEITVEYVNCLDESASDEKWIFIASIANNMNTWTTSTLTGGMVYKFRVCASNAMGTSEPAITEKIKYLDVPGKPLDVYIADVSCTTLILNWEAPENDGGSIINSYCIRQKQEEDEWQYLHEVIPSNGSKQSKSIVVNLTPLKEYYFGVGAKNKIGKGDYKDTDSPIVLRSRGPPEKPVGPLIASKIGHTELTLAWQPPDNRGGLRLTGYTIEKRENSWKKVVTISPEKTEYLIQGLKPGTYYYFQVKANNFKGSGKGLETVKPIKTLDVTGPSKPGGPLKFTDLTRKSITLTWKPPTEDGGSPIIGYDIYICNKREKNGHYWTRKSSFKVKKSETSEKLECTLENLDLDGEYLFRVQAWNVKDSSELLESAESYCPKEYICAPSAPASVDIKDVKESSLTVTWKAPEDDGGRKIVKYHVYHRINEYEWKTFAITDRSKYSCKADNLPFDAKLYFAVCAENEKGTGDLTEAKSPVILEKKGSPSPPTGPLEVIYDDATSLTLSWQSPKFDGGYQLSGYKIYMKEEGSKDWKTCRQSKSENCPVTNLQEDKKYLFKVVARNKKGESDPLEMKEYISTQTLVVPRPPNGPIQYSDLTQRSVTITWKPPDKESSPVSRYKIEYRPKDDIYWINAGFETGTSWTQSNLRRDVGYHFRIVSVNSKGESEPLESDKEIKLRTPVKPAKIMVVDIIDYQVKLKWHPPSDNGSTEVNYYHVFIQQKDSNWEEVGRVRSAQTEFVTEVLRPGEYLFGICAENSIGRGDMVESASRTIIDKKPGVPDIPSGPIEIIDVTDESVTLKWSPPENVGDSPLESYKVYVSHDDKNWKRLEIIHPQSTSYKAKGLKDGTVYKFSIIAKNHQGKGPRLVSEPVMPCREGKAGVGAHYSESNDRSKDSVDGAEKNIESSEDIKKKKEAGDLLLELKSKTSWDDFTKKATTINHVLADSFHIPPRVVFRLKGKSEYKKGTFDIPPGFTAFDSSDNGNSLYNSVSLILFGNENYASRLRLAAAQEGIQNRHFYIQQLFKSHDENSKKIFMKNCLSESSLQEIGHRKGLDSDSLGDIVTKMVVRETAMPESKCNPLQVQFLSSASGFPIKQYFEKGTQSFFETFNDKPQLVSPFRKQGTQIQREGNDWCIHILWVLDKDLGTKSKKVVNRIIPLIEIKNVEDTPV